MRSYKNKFLGLAFIYSSFFYSTQILTAEYSTITCSSDYTGERIKALNAWINTSSKGSSMEYIGESIVKRKWRDNAQACIEGDYPAHEYVISFDPDNLEVFGKFQVSVIYRNCGFLSPEDFYNDNAESLKEMHVTKNFISFPTMKLKIDKNTIIKTGFAMSSKLEESRAFGSRLYTYACNLNE